MGGSCEKTWFQSRWYRKSKLLANNKGTHARIQKFSSGGRSRSNWQKSSDVFFLVLSLFYWSQMVNFEENYHFSVFQRGSNIFQVGGWVGPTFSRGGVQLLIPHRNPHNLWFSSGGPDPLLPPPLWIRTWVRSDCDDDNQRICLMKL